MKLKRDPFPFIFERGDAATRLACLELFGLRGSPQAKACALELIVQQRPDGAFPSQLDSGHWGMRETVRIPLLLLKAGLPPQGVNAQAAITFILDHQNPDGGWSENRALEIPPERGELSNERSVTWLTAYVVELLRQVGMGERVACKAALEWLKSMQNRHGGWFSFRKDTGDRPEDRGDPDSTAQIAFLMGEIYGTDDPAYVKGRQMFEGALDECVQDAERGYRIRFHDGEREGLDAYHLTHLFLASLVDPPRRFQSGYDASDPRVRRMMEALVDIQREDGGWHTFWTQESLPDYTVLAIEALVLSGVLAREDLQARVEPYAG